MKRLITLSVFIIPFVLSHGQETNNVRYSAINPALFTYSEADVFINSPVKYNNGAHIIGPSPTIYPWEKNLENGMPNVVVDAQGNTSVYISSYLIYNPSGGSKVGAMVYLNNSGNIENWTRPNAGLYWYKATGATPDEKISPTQVSGSVPTNIVAVDVESVSFLEEKMNGVQKIRAVYSPQKQSISNLLAVYDMNKTFTSLGILSGFAQMKNDRISQQKMLHFKFTNGGTHLNLYKQDGKYYLNGRVNTRRTYLQPGETPPFDPDPRKRFRRSTVAELGSTVKSGTYDYYTALDMSTTLWEPYSIQSFQLPGFEKDIQMGLVTMYGTDGVASVEMKQRTELAYTVDGVHWKYLKPGVPFLDNGTNPQSDDYGCINIAKPVAGTKFYSDPKKLLYFYASSNHRHVITRQTGISLATGTLGKLAGLKAGNQEKKFTSISPKKSSLVEPVNMIQFYVSKAFSLDKEFYPYVLADVTDDPRGKSLTQLNSYVALLMYAYDAQATGGKGKLLGGVLGSSVKGTKQKSDDYECVPFISGGKELTSKEVVLAYIRDYSKAHPREIISFNTMLPVPVVLEASVKNATFYGIEFKNNSENRDVAVDLTMASHFDKQNLWEYKPASPQAGACQSFDLSNQANLPNMSLPVDMTEGAFALKVTPAASNTDQVMMRMSGDNDNYLSLIYTASGKFQYQVIKDGIPFNQLEIAPPAGKSFAGKSSIITLEGKPYRDRKYLKNYTEDVTVMRVKVPSLSFEQAVHEPITWNWKHPAGQVTQSDTAVARAFSYVPFSSFVAGMMKINIGGFNDSCEKGFKGVIEQMEVSDGLPDGDHDFWNIGSSTRSAWSDDWEKTDDGMDESDSPEIYIYPNPVRQDGIVNLKVNSSKGTWVTVNLFNASGACVKTMNTTLGSGNLDLDYDLFGVSPGIYFIMVMLEDSVTSHKILVTD